MGDETGSDAVETYSSSAADTTGLMQGMDGYIYDLTVPVAHADGSAVKAGDLLTVRVRPVGDGDEEASVYVVLKIKQQAAAHQFPYRRGW